VHVFVKKWIDFPTNQDKMIISSVYTIVEYFTSKNASFFLFVCLSVTYLTYLSFTQCWKAVESS